MEDRLRPFMQGAVKRCSEMM